MDTIKLLSTAEKIDNVIKRTTTKKLTITEPMWVRVAEYNSNIGIVGTITFHFAWSYRNIGLDVGTFFGYYLEAIYIPITKSDRVKKYRIVYLENEPYTKSYLDFFVEPYTQEHLSTTSTLNDIYENDIEVNKSMVEYNATIPEGYTSLEYNIT